MGDFLGTIVSGGLGLLSGGITGLLGVVAQRVFDWLNKREELKRERERWAHERDMRRIDGELLDKEWTHRVRVTEVEAAGKEAVADAAAFGASFQLEPQRYAEGFKPPIGGWAAKALAGLGWLLMVLLDFARGIIRPGLTLYLAWITTRMYGQAQEIVAAIDPAQHAQVFADVFKGIVFTILYLFTTCLLWWFGTRNKQPAPRIG